VKIGYAVEGDVDVRFLRGIAQRWCPESELVAGSKRGKTYLAIRREIPKICKELKHKGADVIVFLRDANNESWREALERERGHVPEDFAHRCLHAVAKRNVECWVVLDRPHAARLMGVPEDDLAVEDPKPAVEAHKDKVTEIVATMRLGRAIMQSTEAAKSLKRFYEDARDLAQQLKCNNFPNELDQ